MSKTMTAQISLNKSQIRHFFLYIAMLAAFIGNLKLWFGASALVLPSGLMPLIIALIFMRNLWLPEKPVVALLLLAGCGLVGMLTNEEPNFQRGIAAMAPWFIAIFTLIIAVNISYNEKLQSFIDLGSVALAGVVCIQFAQIYTQSSSFYAIKTSLETPLGGSNYVATFLLFCVLRNSFRTKRLTIISIAGLVATLSRTSLVLAGIFLLLRFLWERRTRRFGFILIIVVCLIPFVFTESILSMLNRIPGFLILESFTQRLDLWKIIIKEIIKRPFFGLGPGGQRAVLDHFAADQTLWDPHNAILSLAGSFGIIGLTTYIIYFGYGAKAIYIVSRWDYPWKGIFWGLIALIAASMFEPVVFSVGYEMLFALLVGQALALRRKTKVIVHRATYLST